MNERDKFLYPQSRYRGEFTPENLVFNSNIQEFAHKINYICGLETNGKITPEEAYYRIKELWKQLKASKKNLNIGNEDFDDQDGNSNS
ncbi:MAG: hypothetical protein VKK42_07650 [Lyngbya sp.]|nr:hypothetical protein [Lyngbya sp.]